MNRVVLVAIILLIAAIWFSAMANACTPRATGGGFWGPSWGPPIFVGGGGWNQGGWDRGTVSKPAPAPSRSSGGSTIRGGGIKGGSGGK